MQNLEYSVIRSLANDDGNLILDLAFKDLSLQIINAYAPNIDTPEFFRKLERHIETAETDYTILCGDLNITLNPNLDCDNYKRINNPSARNKLLAIMELQNLSDIFRKLNPDKKRFTWRRKNPLKQARLDYFITSNSLLDLISSCTVKPGYRSDHSIIELNIVRNNFIQGKGIWKFNSSLSSNKEYLISTNKIIDDEIMRYTMESTQEGDGKSNKNSQLAIGHF